MQEIEKQDIPCFIFIIDEIISNIEDGKKNLYRDIAEHGSHMDNSATEKTIRRAFKLRQSLAIGEFVNDGNHKPSQETLNVLTAYRYNKKPKSFKVIQQYHKPEIDKYYEKNKPTDSILSKLFKKTPKKISELQLHETTILKFLRELDGMSLEEFIKNWNENEYSDVIRSSELDIAKSELTNYIKEQLEKNRKKQKKASFINKMFGGFGLLFITVDKFDDVKTYLIENYVSQKSAFDDDNEDDDDGDDILDLI